MHSRKMEVPREMNRRPAVTLPSSVWCFIASTTGRITLSLCAEAQYAAGTTMVKQPSVMMEPEACAAVCANRFSGW